jgi:PRTRC genetic system protein A
MTALDSAILGAFPLITVPPSGQYDQAVENGTRYLAAACGLWREITLPWVRVLHPVAPALLALPYGRLTMEVEVRCGAVPAELVREFTSSARATAPSESAAAIVWNSASGEWKLAMRHARSASAAHIEFDEVTLEENDHLVVDVHSHGHYPAFFSSEDNKDDHGAMKFSLVVGSFNTPQPTSEMRLCMAGLVLPARVNTDGELWVNTQEIA